MAINTLPPAGVGDLFCIPIPAGRYTADETTNVQVIVPCKCRVYGVNGFVSDLGGTTVFTDVDLTLKNTTKSESITAAMAAVNSSTIASGGIMAAPVAGTADLDAGDVIELEVDVTGGGGTPVAEGVGANVWCLRE